MSPEEQLRDYLRNVGATSEAQKTQAALDWNAANPDTVITPGSFIKKGFLHLNGCHAEHMWVKVTGEGTGLLWNQPATLPHLHHGQKVSWERLEIQAHMGADEVD